MAGYIGKSQGVTQVDGYNRTEADDRYVNASGDTMTGDLIVNANVGVGTSSPRDVSADGYTGVTLEGSSGGFVDFNSNGSRNGTIFTSPFGGITYDAVNDGSHTFHNNGDAKLVIDSAGRVTMPYQPAAFGKFTAITSTATNYVVGISDVTSRGGMVVSSNRITVPVSGYYLVYANQLISTSGSNYLHIRVNGATNTYAYVNVDNTEDEAVQAIVSLSANDYIDFYMTNTSYTWTGSHSSWFVTLLG